MAKKINEDAVTIKRLLKKGLSQKKICQLLGIKKQKVSYWANHEIKATQTRRKKLSNTYITKSVRWPRIGQLVIWVQKK